MKVILLQDVAKIGRRFNVVSVPDGYATNQLIPKKLAVPATPENLKRTLHHNATVAASKEAGETRFAAAVVALADVPITVPAEANEQNHLFQAVHQTDIVAAAVAAGVDIDVQMVKIETPIKSLGKHNVTLIGNKKNHVFSVEVIKK